MSVDKIIEGNKLIIDFLAWEMEDLETYRFPNLYPIYIKEDERQTGYICSDISAALFHSSFDWIMPVYFKFRDLVMTNEVLFIQHDYWIKKIVEALKYGDISDNPSKAFIVLIQAISWYNSIQK